MNIKRHILVNLVQFENESIPSLPKKYRTKTNKINSTIVSEVRKKYK